MSQSVVDKLNTEQAVNTLEQHYIAVKRELEAVHEHYQKLRADNEARLTSFDQLNSENQRLKQRIVDLESTQYQVTRGTEGTDTRRQPNCFFLTLRRRDSRREAPGAGHRGTEGVRDEAPVAGDRGDERAQR